MDSDAAFPRSVVIYRRDEVFDEPAEYVAHGRLARLVAEETRHDAVGDDAAGARDDRRVIGQDDMAGARAHDRDERARLGDCRRRRRNVGVDVGHGYGDPGRQAGPLGRPRAQTARDIAQPCDRARHLRVDDVGKLGIQRRKELAAGETVLGGPDGLVSGRAVVACLDARQLPDNPVGGLDQPVRGAIDLRRLAQDLERLGEEPLRRDLASVPGQPGLPHLRRDAVDVVRLGLGGVVLPQLHPRVRPASELLEEAQRRAVGLRRQHRAGREVDGDADDRARVYAGTDDDRRHGPLERLDIVVRVLERPVRAQDDIGVRGRQPLVDHAVAVLVDLDTDLAPIGHVDQHCPRGLRPKVDTDRVARLSHVSSRGIRSARPRGGAQMGRSSGFLPVVGGGAFGERTDGVRGVHGQEFVNGDPEPRRQGVLQVAAPGQVVIAVEACGLGFVDGLLVRPKTA